MKLRQTKVAVETTREVTRDAFVSEFGMKMLKKNDAHNDTCLFSTKEDLLTIKPVKITYMETVKMDVPAIILTENELVHLIHNLHGSMMRPISFARDLFDQLRNESKE